MPTLQTNQLEGTTLDKAVAIAQGWQRTSALRAFVGYKLGYTIQVDTL